MGADVFIKKSSASGDGINIVESTVTSAIASSDTDANPQGSYYHEAEVTFADETFTTVTTGTLLMNLTIIR